jgi:predicted lipoprotein with Yx(FWY)xxD motif
MFIALLALAGCGGDEGITDTVTGSTRSGARASEVEKPARNGTRVVLADSEFGRMLFNSKKQAIYIFERDEKNKSNCYGECAAAWPPVLTAGKPRAGRGVKPSLLGTTRRRGGRRQITYAGKPLYYYAHEGPGEVECHNVNLNGGYWWVIGRNGKRRP